jgi:hypothetical protein
VNISRFAKNASVVKTLENPEPATHPEFVFVMSLEMDSAMQRIALKVDEALAVVGDSVHVTGAIEQPGYAATVLQFGLTRCGVIVHGRWFDGQISL